MFLPLKGAYDAAKSAGEDVKGKGGRRKPMPERGLFPRTKVPVPCRTTTLLELRRVGSPKREEYVISKKLHNVIPVQFHEGVDPEATPVAPHQVEI